MLSVSRIRQGKYHDPTCAFTGGEHEFIKHASYVVYGKPEQRHASQIVRMVDANVFVPKAKLDTAHFARICTGIFDSNFSKPFAKNYFNANAP